MAEFRLTCDICGKDVTDVADEYVCGSCCCCIECCPHETYGDCLEAVAEHQRQLRFNLPNIIASVERTIEDRKR